MSVIMIDGARQLPVHHLTIRVPWHDNGWQGTYCNNPCANTSCTILPRVSTGRKDAFEEQQAGKTLEGVEREHLPPCVDEHATIMSPFPLAMIKRHPYSESAKTTHGHFSNTPYTIQPYCAAVIPFRWMLKEQAKGNPRSGISSRVETLRLGYSSEREPDMTNNPGWKEDKGTWIQEGTNQRVLLDTFFSAIKENESLVFFYAKRTPLAEDPRRVIIGVARVKSVGSPTEYRYTTGNRPRDKISGFLWERNVEHSIRHDGKDGFILPYQQLIETAETDESLDLSACAAFAPDEYFEQYSYGSEHLPQDGAIASLLSLEKAIKAMHGILEDVPWDEYLQWIDTELNRLWSVRGAFPGLGAALNAFGLPHGNLLAWYLLGDGGDAVDPWPLLSDALKHPTCLPEYLHQGIGATIQRKWEKLPDNRRNLLMVLARFNLSNEQALRWYQKTEREAAGIDITDDAILENPYRIYEQDRLQVSPVSFAVIDRGLFPPESLRQQFPIPKPSILTEAVDDRRVRSVMIDTLERSAHEGHTLLPTDWLIQRVRARPMKPECPLDADTLSIIKDLDPMIQTIEMELNSRAFQLDRYVSTSKLIRSTITKRIQGKRNPGDHNWQGLVNQAIKGSPGDAELNDDDKKARYEKSVALEEIFRSRISVVMGAAGTGKSTLLKALCNIQAVLDGGVLLLAPTGKARVRLEQASDMAGQGKTIAQFLNGYRRYNGSTGRYYINEDAPRSSAHKTVVIDECSMLTEEQLAALLDALKGVERLILVGDPKQLPPIGAGRPYVDIVQKLMPSNVDSLFPRVASGYVELTVTMRQRSETGLVRADVLLANAFSGRSLDAGADEIWHLVGAGLTPYVKLVRWNQASQLQRLLLGELVAELKLDSTDDEVGFEVSLGAVASKYKGRSNVFFNNRYKGKSGAAEKAENWQILSPVRQNQSGVSAINRLIQQQFRKRTIEMANVSGFGRVIPSPAGPEEIIYGDKVINIKNDKDRNIYPDKNDKYVANGDVGIVVGHRKTKHRNQFPRNIEVELSSQPGFSYTYTPWEFDGQENTPPLELAYALTIHKTQGSEFGITFLIVPNPCRLLSREMLYTALTRHKNKIIILHQNDFRDLYHYSQEQASEVARRMTNLFSPSIPIKVLVNNQSIFLDKNLIYRTERGELVRSKSEWIIADKLYKAGIDYQYEQPLTLDDAERFPDFTIVDDDSGKTWYWEHNGMLSNPEYKERWVKKLEAYRKNMILPLAEGGGANGILLITEEYAGSGLSADEIDNNIAAIVGE